MMREQIKKWFEEAVRFDTEFPQELRDTLLRGHPKLEGFFTRLDQEFVKADELCRKRGLMLKLKTMQDAVYDMTKVFMRGMETEARQRYETDAQKEMRRREADKLKEFERVTNGDIKGTEFEEAGLITNEEIDKQREVGFIK